MLAFGLRLRFALHLGINALHLLAALAAGPTICAAAFPGVALRLCVGGMAAYQLVACFLLPCAGVYTLERRTRRAFLAAAVE